MQQEAVAKQPSSCSFAASNITNAGRAAGPAAHRHQDRQPLPSKHSPPHQPVAALLHQCREKLLGGLRTGIETVNLSAASKMVSEYSGMMVQKHKVGPTKWGVIQFS